MFLGIDIGTSGVKAVTLDERGGVVGQGTAALAAGLVMLPASRATACFPARNPAPRRAQIDSSGPLR